MHTMLRRHRTAIPALCRRVQTRVGVGTRPRVLAPDPAHAL